MDGARESDLALLFTALDGVEIPDDAMVRAVLERILKIDPENDRAFELLDDLDGFDGPTEELTRMMDEAETLASRGLWLQARLLADQIRDQHGDDPVAKAWLTGVHLLWQS